MTDPLPTPACPDCGEPLPSESPQSLCPACLMRQALASRTIACDGDKAPQLPPRSPEEIADRFPGYEILECLGRGGMGAVYKARQKSLNRLVAIKILAPERVGEGRFAERFSIEAELLAKLSHPHIVTIHDFGETGGLFYLVMEFIDGVNLRDLLRDGKLESQQALAIVPPICEALQYAHDKGIVHRDIKPENILLDRDGRVKIADFGIASLVGATGENSGTPPYMAPEQSGGTVDRRADIYALGAVLYEMLTGERPENDFVAPSKRVEVDVKIDEMVLRALEKEPERRYQNAREFRTMVETVVGNLPTSKKAAPIRADKTDESSSRGAWLPYVGLILLLAGMWWTYIWRHDPVEGRAMRPVGVLVAVVGLFFMLKGLLQAVGDRGVDFGYSRRTGSSHHSKDVDHESVVSPEKEARRWKSLRLVSFLGFIVMMVSIAGIIFMVKVVPQWEESLASRAETVPTGMALVFRASHFIQRVWPLMAPLLLILGVGSVTGYVVAVRKQNKRPTQFRWRVALTIGLAFGAVITGPRLLNDYMIRRAGAPISQQLARQAIAPLLEAESLRWETMRFDPNTVSPSDVIVRFTKLERVGTFHDQAAVKPLEGILNLRTLDGILWRADGMEDLRGIQFNFRLGDTPDLPGIPPLQITGPAEVLTQDQLRD